MKMDRKALVTVALVAITLAPAVAAAATTSGTGFGAQAFGQSAGKWAHVDAIVHGSGTQTVELTLAWENDPTPADFDFTVYEPDAFDDGVLTDDEVIARTWKWDFQSPETLTAELEGGVRYPMTVEPIQATGNRWTLTTEDADLKAWGTVIVGTKVMHP